MQLQEIAQLLQSRMFKPFRMHCTDGVYYDIMFPSQCLVTRRTLFIGFPGDNIPPHLASDWTIVDPLHITRIEPIPQDTLGNGHVAG